MDRFLSHLGNPGRYQIIIMVLLAANCIPVVVNHLLMTFYAVKTPHNCRVSIYTLKYFCREFLWGVTEPFLDWVFSDIGNFSEMCPDYWTFILLKN